MALKLIIITNLFNINQFGLNHCLQTKLLLAHKNLYLKETSAAEIISYHQQSAAAERIRNSLSGVQK